MCFARPPFFPDVCVLLLRDATLKLSSTPGTCRPRVESNLIGARALQFRRRGARGAVSIEVLAMFSLLTALSHFAASPPSPPSPPRLISRSSSLASRRWLHGRRCRSNRRSSRWYSSRWCSSRSSSRRRCRCRGARSSRHARLILCACVCGGVFACDAAINYLRHRSSLAAPASRLSAAATRRPMVRPIGDLMQQFSYVLSALVSCVAWYCIHVWYVVLCERAYMCVKGQDTSPGRAGLEAPWPRRPLGAAPARPEKFELLISLERHFPLKITVARNRFEKFELRCVFCSKSRP